MATSRKGIRQFRLRSVTKPMDTSEVETFALDSLSRILTANRKYEYVKYYRNNLIVMVKVCPYISTQEKSYIEAICLE